MNYPFASIWINGRFVSLDSIASGFALPLSPFEHSTFSFMKDWLSDQQTFTIQTSGSTGEPKSISVTREQMIMSAKLTEQTLALERFSDALICIDTAYIGGRMMIVRSFITGMRMWAVDPCACPMQKIPVDQCVNFAAFVPYQVQSMLVSKHPHLLNNPDKIIIGGAPLDIETEEKLQAFVCRCYATYGMTETLSHIALRPVNGEHASPCFGALHGIVLEQDERGCLVIQAPYLAEKIFTNDIVEMVGTDQFIWRGRWDNVINTGGVKVVPEKVEAAIEKIFKQTGITNRFFIHGISDKAFGDKIVLIMEGTGHNLPAIEKTFPLMMAALSPYEVPKEIRLSPAFIVTDTGKVNRLKSLSTVSESLPIKK
jgi:o-succinylbenzoate---CoA ligase